MSEYIPVKNGGIIPQEYIGPYFSNLSSEELSILVGTVILLKKVRFKLLESLLNLKRIEVEEKLGRVLQTDLWEGKFTKNSFILEKLNYNICQQNPNLNIDEKTILAYLKARYIVTFRELQKTFSLNYESAIHYLAKFVSNGLISTSFNDVDSFSVIVYFKLEQKSVEEISLIEKQIVGYVRLWESTSVKTIATDLEVPEHLIQSHLMGMILSDLILCSFDIIYGKFSSFDVEVKIKHFLISFPKRNLYMMNSQEKLIIGLSALQKGVTIKELEQIQNLKRHEIIRIISQLNGTREFEFRLNKKHQIIPISVPVFEFSTNIDDINRGSLINYRSLLGLVKAKQSIDISEISTRMKISTLNAIKGLIDLYLGGFIMGKLVNLKHFKLETMRSTSQEYITFEDWEKIIIGALLSEGKLSMSKIGSLLDLNKSKTHEKVLAFISRNVGDTSISNAFVTMKTKLKIPPLVHLNNIDLIDQQIFCYIITNQKVTLRRIRNLFSISNIEVYRRVYYLVGSGLLQISANKQEFIVKNSYKNTPVDPIDTLDHDLRMLILHLESLKTKDNVIRLGKIASKLDWNVDEVNLDISYLVGFGYYKGYIKGRKFYRQSNLFKFKGKPKCFECKEILDNFREPCSNCFARPPQCSVCRTKMNSSEDIVVCPHCNNSSHSDHIKEWLKIKGICPICRNKILHSEMKPLIPE